MTEKETKKQKWIVTSAWPYVNAIPHLGNLIGSVLSADVFARYCRLQGDDIVFVSGSDMHGTPVAVTAKKLSLPAEELAKKNHKKIKKLFKKWRISYDNYTQTHNSTHIDYVQNFYLDVQKNGYVKEKEIDSLYCKTCNLYLPDRFVEGTCPYCGYEGARGDQCDNPECGKILTPLELKEPRCAICGNRPEVRQTKHWYMDFPKLQNKLEDLIKDNNIIPQNARQMCLNSIKEGIPERAITRDLEWGIPAPFEGADQKSIYVWFEAVLGYISAVKEWADKIKKDPDKFDYFWKDEDTKSVYFIGKDNIIFHLIVFPGLILAYNKNKQPADQLVLPYNVSSTEFLMYENDKFSKSRGVGIWIDDALKLAPVDYWRFNLIINRPEKSDTSFLWSEFENNVKILNDNIGNFIHRTLTFIEDRFDRKVPKKLTNDERDIQFIDSIVETQKEVSLLLKKFELKKALREITTFGKECNVYLNDKAPWHVIKKNKEAAGHVFNLCAQAVYGMAILLAPFIPSTSERILKYLNISKEPNELRWEDITENAIQEGHKINKPEPLFEKLDIEKIQDKLKKLRQEKMSKKKKEKEYAAFEDFQKLDLRIAIVETVEEVPNADKLYKLTVNLGDETRTLAAGLKPYYEPRELKGKRIVMLANLEPKELRGVMSEGMLLAAVEGDKVAVLSPDKDLSAGTKIE
ncbi:MAG: methionine--tRNA ligase [Promethearchaeia archaeon]